MLRPVSYPLLAALLAASLGVLAACGPGEDPDLDFHRGVNALEEGRAERARAHFAADLERHPERAESWRLAGDAWRSGRLQSLTRGVEHWRRYLELEPGDDEVALRITRTLFLLGEWRQAEAWCERLDDGPRSQLLRARVFLEADPARAEAAIAAALAAAADDPLVQATAARIYQQTGDPERAMTHAGRAVELDPLDLRSTYLLARLTQRRGDAEEAAELLATHQLLVRLTGAGSVPEPTPAEALRLLRELEPRLHGEALSFRREKLRLLVKNGRRREARAVLAGLAGAGLPAAARLELAGLAEKLGELATARGLLDSVLDEEPAAEELAAGGNAREALFGLALLAYNSGDRPRARELVEDALQRFPHAARFHHLAGRLELDDGRREEAARSFERALELAPWKSDCRIDLANLWLAAGRSDDVGALLAAAPEADPAIAAYRRRHGL